MRVGVTFVAEAVGELEKIGEALRAINVAFTWDGDGNVMVMLEDAPYGGAVFAGEGKECQGIEYLIKCVRDALQSGRRGI